MKPCKWNEMGAESKYIKLNDEKYFFVNVIAETLIQGWIFQICLREKGTHLPFYKSNQDQDCLSSDN